MIEIKYYENQAKGRYAISAKGHAEYAPAGQDIVCAGVSILMQSLGNYLLDHCEDYHWHELEIKTEAGDMNVEVYDENVCDSKLKYLYHMTIEGLKDIAKQYPQCIKIL